MEKLASEMDKDSIEQLKSLLPNNVKDKLDSVLDGKYQEVTTLKSKLEKLRVNSG